MSSRRGKALAALAVACVVVGCAYVVLAAMDPKSTTSNAQPGEAVGLRGASLMVRAVDPSEPRLNGRVFLLGDDGERRESGSDLACERVYFAAGRGLCMGLAPSGVGYTATIFDADLQPVHEFSLTGLPSRARVSADGRYGAMTVFVAGHAYTGGNSFSTTTTVVDMRSGKELAELEQFRVFKDGEQIDAADFNFWGVTFAEDPNRFYATLHTGDHYYLVRGDLRARTMEVLRDGVECPSLSPDGTRIAFKSRIGNETRWRIRVLDLATLVDHGVAEKRSIDDQVEWLNDRTLVYSDGRNVYTVPADGSGQARLLVRDASSPVRLTPASGSPESRQVSDGSGR